MKKLIFKHWKFGTFWISLLVVAAMLILHNPHNLYSQVETQTIKLGVEPNNGSGEVLIRLPKESGPVGSVATTHTQAVKANGETPDIVKGLEGKFGLSLENKIEIRPSTVLEILPVPAAVSVQSGSAVKQDINESNNGSNVWYVFKTNGQLAEEVCRKLEAEGTTCEPNYTVKKVAVPSDPKYGEQWALPRIQAPEAWDLQTGSSSTKIAIIDTGCDMAHPDLELNINKSLSYDFLNSDADPTDDSEDSHGTHVAGIIAAQGNNAKGVAGLNWKADLVIYKALDSAGEGTIDKLMLAIQRAIDDKADVINMSWGTEEDSLALHEALQAAYDSGIVLVAASGNEGKLLYPAKYEEVLAVGGTGKAAGDPRWSQTVDGKTYESAYGKEIDVAAPAEDIYSTIKHSASEELSYGALSGTSMSSAFVSGEAGLLLSQNNTLEREEIYSIIRENVDPVTTESTKPIGSGRINLFKAVKAVVDGTFNKSPRALIKADPAQGKNPLEVKFSAEGSSDPDGKIVDYLWDFGDSNTGTGKDVTHTYKDAGNFTARLKIKDDKGAIATAATTIKVESATGVPTGEASVEGKVEAIVNGAREPLSGATVTADAAGVALGSAETDADGKFNLSITKKTLEENGVEPVKEGVYQITLTAEDPEFKPRSKDVTVKLGKKTTVNLILTPIPTDDGSGGGSGGNNGNGGKGGSGSGCDVPMQANVCQPFAVGNGGAGQVCCSFAKGQTQCQTDVKLPPLGTGTTTTPTPTPTPPPTS